MLSLSFELSEMVIISLIYNLVFWYKMFCLCVGNFIVVFVV